MRVFSKGGRQSMRSARLSGLAFAIYVSCTAMPPTAFAQMSSYEQQKVVQFLRTPRTEMKLDVFDGTNFIVGTDKTRAYNYMVDFISAMNKATRIVGTMTSHARGTTEGQAFVAEANAKLDYARAMQAAYPAFEKGEAKPAATQTTASDAPAAPTSGTKMMARERASVQQYLDTLNALEAEGTFDGTAFASSVSVDASRSFYASYAKSMQGAANALNKLTGDARRTDEGKELAQNVKRRIALANTIYDALASHQQTTATAQGALPTAKELATVTVHFEKIDALLANGPYDGKTFKDGTTTDEAQAFEKALADAGNAAAKAFSALPDASKQSEAARELMKQVSVYQNKKRPVRSALDSYRRVRGAVEAAEAEKVFQANRAICTALEGSFATSSISLRPVVIETAKLATEKGWSDAHTFPTVQGIDEIWGGEALGILRSCEQHNYTALSEIDFKCRSWAESDHVAWCGTAAAYAKANEVELAAIAEREAKIGPVCEAFGEAVMTRANRRVMKRLFKLSDRNMYDPKLPDVIRFADTVEDACNKPEFEGIAEVDCGGAEPLDNPNRWCRAAIDGKKDLAERIQKSFEFQPMWSARVDTVFGNEDKLLQNGGWISPDTKVTYANLFDYERALTQPQSNNRSLLETLDLLDVDPTKFSTYEDTLDVIDDVTATIEENADSWRKTPVKEDFTGYMTKLAADKLVNNWHPTAKVEGAWLGSSEWNIERTGLGFIDNRWAQGYVMLKLPEDPYCQLHMVFVTERYDGEKFIQSPDIQLKKVRFQDCGLR